MNNLYQEILKDFMNVKTKYKRHMGVKNNKFFNALQVKFAYSFTCHKSQGGQWSSIFLEFPFYLMEWMKIFLDGCIQQ